MLRSALPCLALMLISSPVWSELAITCTGSWTETVNSADLQGPAGADLQSQYESATTAGALDVTGASGPTDNWRIDVRRVDAAFSPSLAVWIRRTDLAGSYQAVTATDSQFLTGQGNLTAATFQVKVTGVTCTIPIAAYNTTIALTVVDLP